MDIYYQGKVYKNVIAAPLFPLDPQIAFESEHEVIGQHPWTDKQEVKEGIDYKLSLNNVAVHIKESKPE